MGSKPPRTLIMGPLTPSGRESWREGQNPHQNLQLRIYYSPGGNADQQFRVLPNAIWQALVGSKDAS